MKESQQLEGLQPNIQQLIAELNGLSADHRREVLLRKIGDQSLSRKEAEQLVRAFDWNEVYAETSGPRDQLNLDQAIEKILTE